MMAFTLGYRRAGRALAITVGLAAVQPAAVNGQVTVVNVIPLRQSGETAQNPEPSLGVNPNNPLFMAAATFTSLDDVCEPGKIAPMFISRSGGRRWSLVCSLPRDIKGSAPGDVVLRYGIDSRLFAALLSPVQSLNLRVYGFRDPASAAIGTQIFHHDSVDQPWTAVTRMRQRERLLVSGNDKKLISDTTKGTGAIFTSDSLDAPKLGFQRNLPERRAIVGQNYATRLASRGDSVVYALFYSPRSEDKADVVVARDDFAGTQGFASLADSTKSRGPMCRTHDGLAGYRVAMCRDLPFHAGSDSAFGQERRVAANLSIAVHPTNSRIVYIAWADSVGTAHYTLHVRRSLDAGQHWSADLDTAINATNPALAVASDGTVGFLYQQLDGIGAERKWVTRLKLSTDGFTTARTFVLARVPALEPHVQVLPYIGDFIELGAIGTTFYGIFSASNAPDSAHFPNGVIYQRRADFTKHVLLGVTGTDSVAVSIDPFFFRVGPAQGPPCPALRRRVAGLRGAPDSSSTVAARTRMREIGCRGVR
jgi:hypothetical protein